MDLKSNALLRHLSEMPAAVIYALADKVHLFNGFELCKKSPVSRIVWSDDGAMLNIELFDAGSFSVSLTFAHGKLSSVCDCGAWSPGGRCLHLVASLATIKKALSPASFPMLQLPANYLTQIAAQLLPPPSPDAAGSKGGAVPAEGCYSLVFDRFAGKVRLRLLQGVHPVTPIDPLLPASVREFLKILDSATLRGLCVEEFLARFGGKFPILYAAADAMSPLSFVASAHRFLLLRLDFREAESELSVSWTLEDGSLLDEASFVFEGYHIDLRQARIERLDDVAVQCSLANLFRRLETTPNREILPDGEGFRLSVAHFNRLQVALNGEEFPQFLRQTALCVNGTRGEPKPVQPSYRLNISEFGEKVHLVGEWVVKGVGVPPPPDIFWFFSAEGRAHLPQPLRAKKRVTSILAICFATLSATTSGELDKILRLALNNPDFCKRGVRSEARKIIGEFWQMVTKPHTVLQYLEGEWLGVAVRTQSQARLLEIPCTLFGYDIFWEGGAPAEMTLDRRSFMKSLLQLRDACQAAGVVLAIGGEELATVAWSFTLDATASSIDWFELRPEISCDGALIDEIDFLEAVKGGGVFRKGGRMVILDEQSSRALSLFTPGSKRGVVRVPRLQILEWIALRRNGVRVLLCDQDERVIDSLTNFESIATRVVPALKATLRPYQRDGYNWLAFLYEHRFGACLADDMGLGKTIQAIALLAGLKEGLIASEVPGCVPHLVVVPPTLIFNWESELARFYPDLKVGVYRGLGRRADFSGLDLVLTSYGLIHRDIEVLGALHFNVIVFDEAQAVKNIHAETTGAVRRLNGRFKLTLTGTPVENHLGEYFSVMDLALPGLLGPYEQFRREMGREGCGFMETLIRRTHPFILRRAKEMIAAELPPKVETDIYLEMSPRQKALYARTVAQVKATISKAYSSNAPGQARIIALTAILKLRQICLSSRLVLAEASDRSPKIEFLIDQLQGLFAEGHSVLVFSQFTSFLDILQEGLSQHGIPFFRLDGSTPVGRRKDLVERFQVSAEPHVFMLSLKAGGRGLNLTRASYVFHLDPWWNPAVENQASDRAHRIGQKSQVTIIRLLMRHSIEEKMMELKKRKLRLYRSLLGDSEVEGAGSIEREDFDFLLG